MILDPVMRREVIGVSHRPSSYVFRTAYVTILGGLLYMIWTFVEAGRFRVYSEFAAAGTRLFAQFSYVQFVLATAAGLLLGADLMPRESRGRTLELLLMSPLTARQVVWGKWKACAAFLMLVIFSSAPVLAVTVYMGGVAPIDFVGVYAATIGWAVLSVALALYYSTRFETATGAVTMSSFLMLMYLLFTPCFSVPFERVGDGMMLSGWVNPAMSIYASVYGREISSEFTWIGALGMSLVGVAVFLGMAVKRVASPWRREAAAMSNTATFGAPAPATGPGAQHGRFKWQFFGESLLERNPMLWRDSQWKGRGGAGLFVRACLIVLAALSPFLLMVFLSGFQADSVRNMVWIVLAALWPAAIVSGGEAFTGEKERNMWEVLMATPMTSRQFLIAKLGSRLVKGVAAFLGILFVLLMGAGLGWGGGGFGLFTAFTAHTVFALFLLIFSGFVSLTAARTRTAILATCAVIFLVVGLVPTASAAWSATRGIGDGVPAVAELALTPTAYHLAIVAPEHMGGVSDEEWYLYKTFAGGIVTFVAIYGGASLVLLTLMVTRLRDLGRRYLG